MTSTMNVLYSYCLQVEHSDMDTIDLIMEEAGYDIYHQFGRQDIFYVKNGTLHQSSQSRFFLFLWYML